MMNKEHEDTGLNIPTASGRMFVCTNAELPEVTTAATLDAYLVV